MISKDLLMITFVHLVRNFSQVSGGKGSSTRDPRLRTLMQRTLALIFLLKKILMPLASPSPQQHKDNSLLLIFSSFLSNLISAFSRTSQGKGDAGTPVTPHNRFCCNNNRSHPGAPLLRQGQSSMTETRQPFVRLKKLQKIELCLSSSQ